MKFVVEQANTDDKRTDIANLEDRIREIRQEILSGKDKDSEYGIINIVNFYIDYDFGAYREENITFSEIVGNKHEWELSRKYNIPFNIDERHHDLWKENHESSFKNVDEIASLKLDETRVLELKEKIKRRQAKMQLLRKKAEDYPAEYMMQGQIIVKGMAIPVTKKELIESGLDPAMFGWKSLEEVKRAEKKGQAIVTAKSIAHATLELPKRAVEGVKELFTKDNYKKEKKEEIGNDIHDDR